MPQWLTLPNISAVREQAKLDGARLVNLDMDQWGDPRLSTVR